MCAILLVEEEEMREGLSILPGPPATRSGNPVGGRGSGVMRGSQIA